MSLSIACQKLSPVQLILKLPKSLQFYSVAEVAIILEPMSVQFTNVLGRFAAFGSIWLRNERGCHEKRIGFVKAVN
jgi:hypothetical protein